MTAPHVYVAMTRAREKLILIGAVKKLADKLDLWSRQGRQPGVLLSNGVLAGASCFLDWLAPVLSRRCGSLKAFADAYWQLSLPAAEVGESDETETEQAVYLKALGELAPLEAGGFAAEVKQALEWRYPRMHAVDKPAKLSVTEIKRRFDAKYEPAAKRLFAKNSAAARPAFIRAERKMTPVEYGVLMHGVMQNLKLCEPMDDASIRHQLSEMVRRNLLQEAQLIQQ